MNLRFGVRSMLTKAVIAQPVPHKACPISSYLFTTMVAAHVLLVLRFCREYPLPIPEAFCIRRRSHQPMNRCEIELVFLFQLRLNPCLVNHLPCQSQTKCKECWISWQGPFLESEVPEAEEGIHLGDGEDEREHTSLPPLDSPTVLDERQSMLQVVVIVHCMPIPKLPIKRA